MKKTLIIIAVLLALAAAFILIPKLGRRDPASEEGAGSPAELSEMDTGSTDEVLAEGSGQGAVSSEGGDGSGAVSFEQLETEKDGIRTTIMNTATILTGQYYDEEYGILPYLAPYMTDSALRSYTELIDPSVSVSDEELKAARKKAESLDAALVNVNFLRSPYAVEMLGYDSALAAGVINIGPSEGQVTSSLVFSWRFIREEDGWKIDNINEMNLTSEDIYHE